MTKKLLFLVAVSGLIFTNNGCTSKKADEDQQVVENADIEKIEADGMGTTSTDTSLESALGETTPSVTPSDASAAAAPTIDDSSLNLDTAATETPAPSTDTATAAPNLEVAPPAITETPLPPAEASTVDTAALAASLGSNTTTTEAPSVDSGNAAVTSSKPAGSSIKKVSATMPYQGKDGGWVNTVYVARPKEKLADISMKIFGTDKTKELKKIAENSYLKSRSVKAGDKIYYVSPNRPDDSSKTLLYYEDMGMVPETYVAKKGENLKKVSKNLLGYDNAWREVWASNAMESKSSLKDGEIIRYWKSADGSTIAAAPPAAESATLVDAAQAPQPTAQIEPPTALPPPPTDANANLPPPPVDAAAPPPTDASAGLPPPPPPPADLAATTEEPKKKINLDEAAAAEEPSGELDSDTMMSMGALGVLVAMMAFVIIRKKKQKAQMMSGEMNA